MVKTSKWKKPSTQMW